MSETMNPGPDRSRLRPALRVVLPSTATVVLFCIAIYAVAIPSFERTFFSQKRAMIKEMTRLVVSSIEVNYEEEQAGRLSRAEAQARAIRRIGAIRYGSDSKHYFWINDLENQLIMHPYRPDLVGRSLVGDEQETHDLLTRFNELVNSKGAGYIKYDWQMHDNRGHEIPKLSYVNLFEPWGWVIGTGVYLQDVEAEIAAITQQLTIVSAAILLFVVGLSSYIVWQGARTDHGRRKAEALLRYEHAFSQQLIDTAPTIVLVLDVNGRVVTVNPYVEQLTGCTPDELKGKDWFETMLPDDCREEARAVFRACFNGSWVRGYVNPVVGADGTVCQIEWYDSLITDTGGAPTSVLAIGYDITDRLNTEADRYRLQQQLHHAQKMEAVGQLASGVAHDFNNLLTVVLGHTESIAMTTPPGGSAAESLKIIEQACRQAVGVTRSLLTFSQQAPMETTRVDLNEIVDESNRILHRMLPSTIDVVLDRHTEPLWIDADATQIQQVVLNLTINARDAMPQGGTLWLTTQPAMPRQLQQAGDAIDPSISYACLSVSDTGQGIPEDVLPRLFEPFFTTKAREQGTGLGLSIIHGIVSHHGGHILVDTELGRGSTFTVMLPLSEPLEGAIPVAEGVRPIPVGDGRTILVGEDRDWVREILVSMLHEYGYQLIEAGDGDEIMQRFEENRDRLDMLVFDLELPRRSGLQCLAEIRAQGVRLPAILITGSSDPDIDRQLDDDTTLLRKPFQMGDFVRLVATMINQAE